jgi:ectoine hydroxylase-related dioxygenase (phytanoyl-CoA dioxygenase family)
VRAFADRVLQGGYCLLPQHFSPATLTAWREAFQPLFDRHVEREGHRKNRGQGRYYVTLPFAAPFADPAIYEDDDLLAIVEHLVGNEPVMPQLATDTPILGSEHQATHRDTPPLFPEWKRETPPYQLAVNFPLVDVTLENGPTEIARATHLMDRAEGLRRIESGEIPLEPITMRLGDVMIRDVRGLHRGTPNRTSVPRPMCVIGYSRRWLFRPEVSIRVPRAALETLSDRARSLLRFNPIVDSLEDEPEERYQAFAY